MRSINIEWTRGDKKTELKDKVELTPEKTVSHINQTFSKLSVFYYYPKKSTYHKKIATLKVTGFTESLGFKKESLIGQLDLDISHFVGSVNELKQFNLNKAPANSMISLQISIIKDDGSPAYLLAIQGAMED